MAEEDRLGSRPEDETNEEFAMRRAAAIEARSPPITCEARRHDVSFPSGDKKLLKLLNFIRLVRDRTLHEWVYLWVLLQEYSAM